MSYREISRIMGISVKTVSNPRYSVKFTYDSYAVVNSEKVASEPKAVAGINAGYEPEAIYIMIDGRKISGVTLPPDHLRYWKHEACIFSSGDRTMTIPGNVPSPPIFSSSTTTNSLRFAGMSARHSSKPFPTPVGGSHEGEFHL